MVIVIPSGHCMYGSYNAARMIFVCCCSCCPFVNIFTVVTLRLILACLFVVDFFCIYDSCNMPRFMCSLSIC